jgi:cytochrome P450
MATNQSEATISEAQTGGCPVPHTEELSEFDVRCPAASIDRLNFWENLRDHDPVYFNESLGIWYVTRYADVQQVLMSPAVFGKQVRRPLYEPIPEAREILQQFTDEFVLTFDANLPDHTFFKRLVRAPMTGARVLEREPVVKRIANQLIDGFEDQGEGDLIGLYAYALPAVHMFDYIGVDDVPIEDVRAESLASNEVLQGFPEPEQQVELARLAVHYWQRLKDVVDDHIAHRRDDIVSELLAAVSPEGRRIERLELVSLLRGLILGAHRTSTNLIGSTMFRLLSERERWERVLADHELVAAAVNETLRNDSPAVVFPYLAFTDTELGGKQIKAGDKVYVCNYVANHDPLQFDDPDVWDMDREGNTRNLAFGGGIHLCPGTALGRVTVTTAVRTLAERLPDIRLTDPELHPLSSYFSFGPDVLPVRWD